MGKRGPLPTPSSLLKMRGTFRASRRFANEPTPPAGRPSCPRWLRGEARAEWKRLLRDLEVMGILSRCDRGALSVCCQLWQRWVEAEQKIRELGLVVQSPSGYSIASPYVGISNRCLELLSRYWREFGLSPSARTGLHAAAPAAAPSPGRPKFFTDQREQTA